MFTKSSGNIFEDLGLADPEILKIKSDLMRITKTPGKLKDNSIEDLFKVLLKQNYDITIRIMKK